MRIIATLLALLATVVLIAASCGMNFMFWHGQGKTETDALMLGSTSVALDVLKSVLPVLIALAVARRRWVYAVVGSFVFLLLVASALLSAIGFLATNRVEIAGGREALTARLELTTKELAELDPRLRGLGETLPSKTLEADLAAQRVNRLWTTSKECMDATAPASRSFCASYQDLAGKLASTVEAERLRSRQGELRKEAAQLRGAGAGRTADPQTALISRLVSNVMPATWIGDVGLGITVFLAMLIELGAALGLFLTFQHGAFGVTVNQAAPSSSLTNTRKPLDSDNRNPVVLDNGNLMAPNNGYLDAHYGIEGTVTPLKRPHNGRRLGAHTPAVAPPRPTDAQELTPADLANLAEALRVRG